MELWWGSRFVSVVFDLDLFSLLLLVSLLMLTAWLLSLLFALRLELGAVITELRAFSELARDARQFVTLSSKETAETINGVLKAVAREFFVGSLVGSFFSIRVEDAMHAKRLQQAFALVREEAVNGFCARLERALTIGRGISLLSLCAVLVVVVMYVLQHGAGGLAGVRADCLVVASVLFCFLGAWSYLVCTVMSGFLRTHLALFNYEFKRLGTRLLLLADKK